MTAKYLPMAVAAGVAILVATPSMAMTIKNADAEIRRIVVTEEGERTEQDVLPNETVTLCAAGCFITFPNGALTAYEGTEDIIIKDGGPALPN